MSVSGMAVMFQERGVTMRGDMVVNTVDEDQSVSRLHHLQQLYFSSAAVFDFLIDLG